VIRFVARNRLLELVLLYPPLLAVAAAPGVLARYWAQRRAAARAGAADPGGVRWVLAEFARLFRAAVRERSPVKVRTLLRWRAIGRTWPRYAPPTPAARPGPGRPPGRCPERKPPPGPEASPTR
jgi:hypothetical protein